MVIFDLDGTLADCEHRRHLVDPSKHPDVVRGVPPSERTKSLKFMQDYYKSTGELYKPDYKAFNEACDQDKPIKPVVQILNNLVLLDHTVEIWTGRCESVRDKTEAWLANYVHSQSEYPVKLKMCPIAQECSQVKWFEYLLFEARGDRLPKLKEGESRLSSDINFDFVEIAFLSDWLTIEMFRDYGIFVLDCSQV